MASLLDQKLSSSNRVFGKKKRSHELVALTELPSVTEPKELFAVMHRQSSRDNLTVNLSRAVIQNAWQPSRYTWQEEFGPFDDSVEYIVIVVGRQDGMAHVRRTALTFLDNARRLDERDQTDAALDIIFDQIDEMLIASEFDQVDQLLAKTTPSCFSVELLLGMLTATLPAKNRLRSRTSFFEQVRQTLLDRGETDSGLLVGLD